MAPEAHIGQGIVENPAVGFNFRPFGKGWTLNKVQQMQRVGYHDSKRIGAEVLVIRSGPHAVRNQHDPSSGEVTTIFTGDGQQRSDLAPAGEHIAVWAGESFSRLLIQGHIYLERTTGQWQIISDPPSPPLCASGEVPKSMKFWLMARAWDITDHYLSENWYWPSDTQQ
ncbi:hypothetical protein B0T22DRAFT_445731 [Podospora appendiculata]|uniref:Uncharacterized protein n=1 Tax=Podospora appendiculata TaxID=314037 RepID=A0AAE0WZG4_9PEZI|nr:hypothetical protein B0T22DRAFT_445731 [Podospora appendiculata]